VDIWIVVAIFSSVVVLAQRYQTDQYRKRLERERLETELNFLKAQINPHFLFNALNSIFVLIGPENKTAGNALLKFSGLLRYQLYECTESKVSLAKELDSLKNYIELAEMRNDDNLKLHYEFPEETEGWYIAPFLLVPLVENAFKHISHYQERENSIGIRVTLTGVRFHFSIDNTYDTGIATASKNSGIGLRNVRRRLELLYPGRHELTIEKEHGVHKLNLILDEKDNELSHS
jgi:LytS/YehU family sensor histidine kinase